MKTINKGYKKTDIGIIPEDWKTITFGKAFDFLSTANYPRDALFNDGSIFYVHYGDIHTKFNHFLDLKNDTLPSINLNQVKKYSLLQDGDIIMADASEDYNGICKSVEIKNIEGKKIISGLHTFLLRDTKNNFADGFKGYIHSNKLVKSQFERLATGLKVYGVSKGNLKSIQIPLPPLPEQKRIAAALSDMDSLLNNLEELIAKKRSLKQGAMQELLKPKKGWVVKKLGEVAEFNNGKPHENCISANGVYTVINSKFISTEGEVKKYSDKMLSPVYIDDIVMVMSDVPNGRAIAKCFFVNENDKYTLNQRICSIKAVIADAKFLFYVLNRNDYYLSFDDGVKQTNLRKNDILDCPLNLPSLNQQESIAKILSEIDLEIEVLEGKRAKYQQMKTGMMQELLTGRVRLV